MFEKMSRSESAPKMDPYEMFETFANEGEWSPATEEKFRALLESNESDVYMVYLNYKESGLVDELSEHERSLFEWLKGKFEEESNFISRIQALQLPEGQYIVCGSGILDLLGIRRAGDIDLLVSPELFAGLAQRGWVAHPTYPDSIEHPDDIASAKLHLDFMREDYTLDELLPKAYIQDGIPFMNLETLREAKVQMGREKDLRDIQLIDAYRSK